MLLRRLLPRLLLRLLLRGLLRLRLCWLLTRLLLLLLLLAPLLLLCGCGVVAEVKRPHTLCPSIGVQRWVLRRCISQPHDRVRLCLPRTHL